MSALLLAFTGGLLLNVMPCVFPVLAIKVLGLLEQTDNSRRAALMHGALYAAGVVLSMCGLAGLLIALRAGGEQIGWGFQLQSPLFVALLIYLFAGLGFYLLGAFELGSTAARLAAGADTRAGYSGSFLSGVLAVAVATPCSAPFMGSAIGAGLLAGSASALYIFAALGAGMALPYAALCALPGLTAQLPRPGRWMLVVKQLLAFPLFATAIWLLSVLARVGGEDAVIGTLSGVLLLALAAWLFRLNQSGCSRPAALALHTFSCSSAAGALVLAALVLPESAAPKPRAAAVETTPAKPEWLPFSQETISELRAQRRAIYLEFTAKWCITCQVNKQLVFSSSAVLDALREHDFALVQADWTSRDAGIAAALAGFGRASVPLSVIYPRNPDAKPLILPAVLSPDEVLRAIDRALRE